MRTASRVAFILSLCSLLAACSSDPASPSDSGTTTNPSGQPVPSFASKIPPGQWGGSMATIQFSYTAPGFPFPIDMNMGFAQFGQTGIDAGSVSVNDNDLGRIENGSTVVYNSFSPTSPTTLDDISFDGSDHTFIVSGSTGVPAMTQTVRSATSFTLTTPVANSTIQKASGITVQWSGGSASSDEHVLIAISPSENDRFAYVREEIPNTGSYTIPAADLAPYSGQVTLHVARYRYVSQNHGGKEYFAFSEVAKQLSITLQ